MSPHAENFLALLRARSEGRKRILPAVYRSAFAEIFPTLSADEFRSRLAAACQELAAAERLSLPRSPHRYDRAAAGDLPAWLELTEQAKPRELLPIDPVTFAWAPELRFACEIRDKRQLDVLLRVQRFLAGGGRTRPFVPAKERSVELFGEEKRLETLKDSALFGDGRLTLKLLRCFIVRPPLVREIAPLGAQPRPLLVLENHSTYHSFSRWNRERGCFSAIVFGNGDSFKTGAAGLVEVVREVIWDGRLFYFGDLDIEGLLIPLMASATLHSQGLPELQPHRGCYQRLIERASTIPLPAGTTSSIPADAGAWLGVDLARQTGEWLGRGVRIPQELIGWEELLRDGSNFAMV